MDFETCRATLDQWKEIFSSDPATAQVQARRNLAVVQTLGNPPELLALALSNMGASNRHQGNISAAIQNFGEAANIYRLRTGYERAEANNYRRLAYSFSDAGRHDDGLDSADRAMKIYSSLRDTEGVASCWLAVAHISYDRQQFAAALEQFAQALPDLSPGVFFDYALHNLKACFVRVQQSGQKIRNPKSVGNALRLARMSPSSIAAGKTDPPAQRNSFGNSRPTPADAKTRWVIGLLLEMERQYKSAAHFVESGMRELARHGARLAIAEAGLDLCRIYARMGRWRSVDRAARETVAIIGADLPEVLATFEEWQRAAHVHDFERLRALSNLCRDAIANG